MYEYYRMQDGYSDDSHFDYCDHDDFSSSNSHFDESYYCKDYGTPYIERYISSDLNKIMFFFFEYLNSIDELAEINLEFIVDNKGLSFYANSNRDFCIFIHPTVKENMNSINNTFLSLKELNSNRYNKIVANIDISSNIDSLLFSLLHEVGHCVHIYSSHDEYFSICNNCKYDKNDSRRGICNNCSEEKKQKFCNYYCEITADEFAFKHLPLLKKMLSEATTKDLDE